MLMENARIAAPMRRNPSMPSHPWAMLRRKSPDTMTFPSTRASSPGVIPLMIFEPAPALRTLTRNGAVQERVA